MGLRFWMDLGFQLSVTARGVRWVCFPSICCCSVTCGGSGAVCALCTGLVSRLLAIVEVWWLGSQVVVVLLGFSYWFSVAGACEELLSRSSRLSLESSVAARGGPRDSIRISSVVLSF